MRAARLTARLTLAVTLTLAVLAGPTAATAGSGESELGRESFQINVTSTGLDGELDEQATVDHANLTLPHGTERLRLQAAWADPEPEPIHVKVFTDECLTNNCGSPIAQARADGSVETTFQAPDETRLHLHVVSDEETQAHRTVRGNATYLAAEPDPRPASARSPSQPEASSPGAAGDTPTATWIAAATALGGGLAAWRWLTAVGLFHRFDKDELLENPVRRRIVEAIEADPGLHLEAIVRRLDLSRGQADHHLSRLVDAGLLVEQEAAGYRAYFRPGQVDADLRQAVVLLKTDGARRLLEALQRQAQAGVRQLSRCTGLAASTVSYHADRLQRVGLVEAEDARRGKALSPTELARRALDLVDQDR